MAKAVPNTKVVAFVLFVIRKPTFTIHFSMIHHAPPLKMAARSVPFLLTSLPLAVFWLAAQFQMKGTTALVLRVLIAQQKRLAAFVLDLAFQIAEAFPHSAEQLAQIQSRTRSRILLKN